MKDKWLDEQQAEYKNLPTDKFKKKIISDLLEALDRVNYDDYETAYRMAGGAVKAMYENQGSLIN